MGRLQFPDLCLDFFDLIQDALVVIPCLFLLTFVLSLLDIPFSIHLGLDIFLGIHKLILFVDLIVVSLHFEIALYFLLLVFDSFKLLLELLFDCLLKLFLLFFDNQIHFVDYLGLFQNQFAFCLPFHLLQLLTEIVANVLFLVLDLVELVFLLLMLEISLVLQGAVEVCLECISVLLQFLVVFGPKLRHFVSKFFIKILLELMRLVLKHVFAKSLNVAGDVHGVVHQGSIFFCHLVFGELDFVGELLVDQLDFVLVAFLVILFQIVNSL
jgi:hypothetical protein